MFCQKIKKNGERCKRKVNINNQYCFQHKEIEGYQEPCSICFDDVNKSDIILECKHIFHRECLEGLISLSCPNCRKEITKIPKALKNKINRNKEKYKEEIDNERENELRQLIASRPVLIPYLMLAEVITSMRNNFQFHLNQPVESFDFHISDSELSDEENNSEEFEIDFSFMERMLSQIEEELNDDD